VHPLLAVVQLAALAPAAQVPKSLKKATDAELIVGTWKPTGGDFWYQFNSDGSMKTWHGPNRVSPTNWTYTLDPTSSPKRAKLTSDDGRNGGRSYDCIYELDGDSLKIAFVLNPKTPPTKVEDAPGLQLYEQTRDTSAK
jgi:uncharacterized protein (TIGR03067 family)